MERVATYIDGFNLYYGMRSAYGRKYLWLDLEAMCRRLLRSEQTLVAVKYFTARVRYPEASQRRQNTYLDALRTTSVETIFGRLQVNIVTCKRCGEQYRKSEEKKTDVAIATHLVHDAHVDVYDAAMIVGGDSDMVPPVELVSSMASRRVVVANPPKRHSGELRRAAGANTFVSERVLRSSQLPSPVTLPNGVTLARPAAWVR